MRSDPELLSDYATGHSEEAFRELVRRHIDFVFSAALRQVGGDAHLAHDVAQSVFVDLARKSAQLATRPTLAGWLYTSTHFAAAKVVRGERRRRAYEHEATFMDEPTPQGEPADWPRLRGVLDAAMLELDAADREAVLLRFFNGRSFAEIGAALRLNEDAARKRVDRALDKLHGLLARRGISSTATALGAALAENTVHAAPAATAAKVSGAVFAGVAEVGRVATGASFFAMSKVLSFVAAGLVIALALLWRSERAEAARLNAATGDADRQRASLTGEIAATQRRVADLRAQIAAMQPTNPGIDVAALGIKPASGRRRLDLDSTYAALFRRLKLEPARLDAFKNLLVARTDGPERTATRLCHERGIDEEALTFAESAQLKDLAARPIDDQIRDLIGGEKFEIFRAFERTAIYRAQVRHVEDTLRESPEPLSDDQMDLLTTSAARHIDFDEVLRERTVPSIPEVMITEAAAFLTPYQMVRLRSTKDERDAMRAIVPLNREAAEKGLLHLTAQSARDYPTAGKAGSTSR
jgi:RNA polymerase sigma factor (sigma-70 family)